MNELALFAGAGGGILGGVLLGWHCIGAVEIEKYPRKVLLARQRDGIINRFPVWDDVRTFDGKPWRGLVDVVSGGFPCQDISCAGKGVGINGERSGLWAEMHRIICEVRPRFAFMENSPMLTSRGLGRVLGDLAEIGNDACWTCLSAADCGAPHRRERIWILGMDRNANSLHEQAQRGVCRGPIADFRRVRSAEPDMADTASNGLQADEVHARNACQTEESPAGTARNGIQLGIQDVPDTASGGQQIRLQTNAGTHSKKGGAAPAEPGARCTAPPHPDLPGHQKQRQPEPAEEEQQTAECNLWWGLEPDVGRVADGVANRVDRLKSLGNGQVPIVAATAFRILYRKLTNQEYQP